MDAPLRAREALRARLGQLLRAEKQNRTRVASAVLAGLILLGPRRVAVAALTVEVTSALHGTQARASALAARHARNTPTPRTARAQQANRLQLDAAAGALASTLVRSVHIRLASGLDADAFERSYPEVASGAVRDNLARIGMTADTEFYREYNDRYIAALDPATTLEWIAILDRVTCAECAELDGSRVLASTGFATNPPLHPRCRCVVSAV